MKLKNKANRGNTARKRIGKRFGDFKKKFFEPRNFSISKLQHRWSICGGIGGRRKKDSFLRLCESSRTGKILIRKIRKQGNPDLFEEESDLKGVNLI